MLVLGRIVHQAGQVPALGVLLGLNFAGFLKTVWGLELPNRASAMDTVSPKDLKQRTFLSPFFYFNYHESTICFGFLKFCESMTSLANSASPL